jgi:endothelin-converting enzyme
MSLTDADSLTPQIHLSKVVNSLAPSGYKPSRLIVMTPQYMEDLASILNNTSKEVLQTYFLWKAIQAFSSDVEADAIKSYRRFANELQGKVSHHLSIQLLPF